MLNKILLRVLSLNPLTVAPPQVVYRKQRRCCVTCGEQGSLTLPCGHGLQCESCSASTECPLCPEQTPEPLS